MKKLLKIFNPIIYVINLFMYMAHVDMYRGIKYEPYDFSKDIKYF